MDLLVVVVAPILVDLLPSAPVTGAADSQTASITTLPRTFLVFVVAPAVLMP